jgi:hypothetical protein
MVDTSNVDIQAFYERYSRLHGRKPSRVWQTGEHEYHSSCPWCGGTNRFMFIEPSGRYSCAIRSSGCGRHGNDVIDFLRDYEGMNFFEACEHLEVDPGSEHVRSERMHEPLDQPPPAKWQDRALAVVNKAQHYLWSKSGEQAFEFLLGRGFTDEMILSANLGYIPLVNGRWYKDSADLWGLPVQEGEESGIWIPEGILIPWYIGSDIWRLNIRRLTGLQEGGAKYISISGGSEALYNADSIKPESTAVLCESELDALAGTQAAGRDDVVFVATGSTSRARRARWIARLCMASCVLVAFDDDPPKNGKRAGDAGAKHWIDILPQSIRWTPWSHDINDMLKEGKDIKKWIALGKEVHQAAQTPIVPDKEPAPACADCGAPITDESREYRFTNDGICYCSQCRSDAGQLVQSEPEEPEPMTEERFMDIVQQIADVRAGGSTIYRDPPGYTIQDRAREIMQERQAQEQAKRQQALLNYQKRWEKVRL